MPATQPLNVNDAHDVLVAAVHAPVFFEKLASVYGIQPNGPDEARDMLTMAAQLRNAHEQQTVKQASATTSFLSEAKRDLNHVLNQQGFQPIGGQVDQTKQAAKAAAQNPLIKEAALVFYNALQGR